MTNFMRLKYFLPIIVIDGFSYSTFFLSATVFLSAAKGQDNIIHALFILYIQQYSVKHRRLIFDLNNLCLGVAFLWTSCCWLFLSVMIAQNNLYHVLTDDNTSWKYMYSIDILRLYCFIFHILESGHVLHDRNNIKVCNRVLIYIYIT